MKIINPNFLKGLWHPSKGMLGMVEAPGKYDKKLSLKRDLQKDLSDLKNIHKVDTLISFLEHKQMEKQQILREFDICTNIGIQSYHFPIVDRSIPANLPTFKSLIAHVVDYQIKQKQRVVLAHCHAGLGRTGLFSACCLVYSGFEPEQAMKKVRETRKGTVQVESQEEFIKEIFSKSDYK